MTIKSYQDLNVWQQSIAWVDAIYDCTKQFLQREIYGLANQLRRSSISVPSNIAEGATRGTKKEYIRFIHIARGSLSEAETQIIISHRRGFINQEQSQSLLSQSSAIGKMLYALQRSLSPQHTSPITNY